MEEEFMTIQTKKFIYTLSGKQAPYKVMKFNLSGVFVEYIGFVEKPLESLIVALAEKHEMFLSEAKGSLSVAAVAKKPRSAKKKK